MATVLQRFLTGGKPGAHSGAPRLAVAAFGKHPGWNDYLGAGVDTGIGVDTEMLSHVKQVLHVGGIRGQIDSGAWTKLEPGKRLEGFDHAFLWFEAGHVALGELWSSTDGRRRPYPMILCVDGQGVSAAFLLARARPELLRLREACKAAATGEQVVAECRAAQARLASLAADPNDAQVAPTLEARRNFLAQPAFGHQQLGLLRVLHELGAAPGLLNADAGLSPEARAGLRACHLRLPLAGDLRGETLELWAMFLQYALSDFTPLLLMARNGAQWIDAIVGEPAADDFFWLQASLAASPLTTEIPFEISPEVRRRFGLLEARFLESDAPGADKAAPAETKAPEPPASARDAADGPPEPTPAAPQGAKKRKLSFLVGGGIVVVAALAAFLVMSTKPPGSGKHALQPAAESKSPPASAQPAIAAPAVAAQPAEKYRAATNAAMLALRAGDFREATNQAGIALLLEPADSGAADLMHRALAGIEASLVAARREQQYERATNASVAAYRAGNYASALAEATNALGLKHGDSVAENLRADAQREINRVAAARRQELDFQGATNASAAAYRTGNYSNSLNEANNALRIKPGDPVAGKLRDDAQQGIERAAVAMQQELEFQQATNAATVAYLGGNYAGAVSGAKSALRTHASDPAMSELLAAAQKHLDLAGASRTNQALAAAAQPIPAPKDGPPDGTVLVHARESAQAPQPPVLATPVAAVKPDRRAYTNAIGMEFIWNDALPGGGAFVGKYEVTQKQYGLLMNGVPDGQYSIGGNFPVGNVTLAKAQEFCDLMGKRDGRHYSLPSQDEWLALAGLSPAQVVTAWDVLRDRGALANEVTSLASSAKRPAEVGSRGAQANGLCDLFGNVRELVIAKGEDGKPVGLGAGFSYFSRIGLPTTLFLLPQDGWLQRETGFRCILRQ